MDSITNAKKVWLGLLALLILLLSAPPAAVVTSAQETGDWSPVTIVYNSDVVGKIEPCG
ncbi:hypothetical protein H8E07_08640 [bacterium]|nr:hypothetical protein [bacterium]